MIIKNLIQKVEILSEQLGVNYEIISNHELVKLLSNIKDEDLIKDELKSIQLQDLLNKHKKTKK